MPTRPRPHPAVDVLDGRPLRLTLGLRRLDLDAWLELDDDLDDVRRHKQRLLDAAHDEVVAVTPAGARGSAETLHLVTAWIRAHHPTRLRPVDASLHPVDAAARLVAEDICVLTRDTQGWRLSAASVCSPSRWRLRDKIGRSVSEIHAPVPDYAGWYSDAVDAALDRVTVDRPVWRTSWTILDDPALFQQTAGHAPSPQPAPGDLTFRVERQTLRRLPGTRDLVFTIRTRRAPLADVAADRARADALARTLRSCSPELARYRGWAVTLPRVIEWLDDVAGIGSSA